MNEDIKEILDYLKKEVDKFEDSKTYLMEIYNYREKDIENIQQHKKYVYFKKLLNYITNLQNENEELKNQLDFIEEQNKYIDKLEKMIKDYKSRNEKAIEYIKIELSQGGPRETSDLVDGYDLLNILKGGDE